MKHLSDNNFNNNQLDNVPTPVDPSDAANKAYVDSTANSKEPIISGTTDSIQEWWIYPLATYLKNEERTVYGGISSTGKILANEVDHSTGQETRVECATAQVDDHNCPALWAEDGRRLVLAWTNHNGDMNVRFKVSDANGTVSSLATATEHTYTASAAASYTQIHKIDSLSTTTNDVLWVFSRIGSNHWAIISINVNQTTGAITTNFERRIISLTSQAYITTAPSYDANGTIRVAVSYNPTQTASTVYYLEINPSTGAITSPGKGTVGNISGTNLPLQEANMGEAIAAVPVGYSRRLFYVRPGPALPAIACADWATGTPDEAIYKVAEATSSAATSWNTFEYGVAGPRVGYIASSNYISGMAFPNPAYQNDVIIARKNGDYSTIELHNSTTTASTKKVIATSTTTTLHRPVAPINGGPFTVMYSDISEYDDDTFREYYADTKFALGHFSSTNTIGSGKFMQSGWGSREGYGELWIEDVVTFPIAFKTPPIVVATPMGAHATSGQAGNSPSDFTAKLSVGQDCQAGNITTTGFVVRMVRPSGTYAANRWFGYSWIAIET